MRHSGHRCTAHLLEEDVNGSATIAELLVVLVVSSILFVAVMGGQTFVTRLAERFFDGVVLETESRLLLAMIGSDLSRAEELTLEAPNAWKLDSWAGDTIQYLFRDSALWRNGSRIVAGRVSLPAFTVQAESTVVPGRDSVALETRSHRTSQESTVRVRMTLTHKARRLAFDALFPLYRRAPGT